MFRLPPRNNSYVRVPIGRHCHGLRHRDRVIRTLGRRDPGQRRNRDRRELRPALGFDVFDGQGRYLGIVELPDEMPLGLLFCDRLFGIVKDELDVEYLRVYRIEGLDPAEAASG